MAGEQRFTCKIELSKPNGIAISIRDLTQPEQVYKQVLLEGESLTIKTNKLNSSATITQTELSLTTEVKDDKGSTKIEQGPEAITVTCKSFTVNAETIALNSSKDTTCKATGKFTIESTSDFTLDSKANAKMSSKLATNVEAQTDLNLKATANMKAKAPKIELAADASLDAKSSGALNVKGAAVSVKGDMRAELDSPSTTVGSAMTTIQGQVVSVSGSLVKLG